MAHKVFLGVAVVCALTACSVSGNQQTFSYVLNPSPPSLVPCVFPFCGVHPSAFVFSEYPVPLPSVPGDYPEDPLQYADEAPHIPDELAHDIDDSEPDVEDVEDQEESPSPEFSQSLPDSSPASNLENDDKYVGDYDDSFSVDISFPRPRKPHMVDNIQGLYNSLADFPWPGRKPRQDWHAGNSFLRNPSWHDAPHLGRWNHHQGPPQGNFPGAFMSYYDKGKNDMKIRGHLY